MRKALKLIGFLLLAAIVLIQFFPPDRNNADGKTGISINQVLNVPDSVNEVFKQSCFDCHSNTTRYPWYTSIQPAGWYLANHVKEGKAQLNLDEFGNYSARRQLSKLKSIAESVESEDMPLKSYLLLHPDARMSGHLRTLLINWALKTRDSLEVAHK